MQDLIHEETREGFAIKTYRLEEDYSPVGMFDGEGEAEILANIADGTWDWFCVRITASKNGIQLAEDYLGGCCYASASDFVTAGDYYEDMVDTVITEARETLAKLAA